MNACEHCNATIIGSQVCHEPFCPTWDKENENE